MRKLRLSAIVGLLCSLALASQADIVGFEIEVATTGGFQFIVPPANGGYPTPHPAPPIVVINDFTSGVSTNSANMGRFRSFITDGFNNMTATGSNFSFGLSLTNNTSSPGFPDVESYLSGTSANIGFYLTATDGTNYETNFLILRGTLSGGFSQTSATTSSSSARFNSASLDVYSLTGAPLALGLAIGNPVLLPGNFPAYFFDLTPYFTLGPVHFWVNQLQLLSSPTLSTSSLLGYISSKPVSVRISGRIVLEDCFNSVQSVVFEFRPKDGTATFVRIRTLNADGTFQFDDIPARDYNVAIKGTKWLKKVTTAAAALGNINIGTITLIAGDANNDNSADVLDLDLLIQAFDTTPTSSRWNAGADFNCDNSVDVLDLDLLLRNFDQTGDP